MVGALRFQGITWLALLLWLLMLPKPARAAEIVGWGSSTQDGLTTPPSGDDYIAISAGADHVLALKTDGSIVGWGRNNIYGKATPPPGHDYIAVAAGDYVSIALKANGTIIAWGDGGSGISLQPTCCDHIAIAAGRHYGLALTADSSIIGWGYSIADQILPAGNDYIAISAGSRYNLALKADGSIVGWGDNEYGQATPPPGNDYVAISAGWYYSLALKADGSIVGWGNNEWGQATPPPGNDYVAISAGMYYSLALKADGSIVDWGRQRNTTLPTDGDYIAIAAGHHNTSDFGFALKSVFRVIPKQIPFVLPAQSQEPIEHTLILHNEKHKTAEWALAVEGDCSWLEVDKNFGTLGPQQLETITLTASPQGLSPNTYACTLTITNSLEEDTDIIPITFTIPPQPILVPQHYSTIQAAINAAHNGDTVLVSPGEYVISAPLTFNGKAITVKAESELGASVTTIRMGTPINPNHASVLYFTKGETASSILDGFTITGGRGESWQVDWGDFIDDMNAGGGIYCVEASPTIRNCTITGNSTWREGGNGGGIYCSYANSTIMNCTITGNTTWSNGGGIWCGESSVTIKDCLVSNNTARSGGGIFCEESLVTIIDCMVSNNIVDSYGSGLYCQYSSEIILSGCTFAGNSAIYNAIWCCGRSHTTVTNCIIWNNAGGALNVDDGSSICVDYSCIEDEQVWPGTGNIYQDPLFCGWETSEVRVQNQSQFEAVLGGSDGFNFALSCQSPCLGTGQDGTNMGADAGICDSAKSSVRTIVLEKGVYQIEGFNLACNVSIQGAGPSETIIEGTVSGLRTGASLSGITIRNGTAHGIRINRGDNPSISNCVVTENAAGGILYYGESIIITDCMIAKNSGAGISGGGTKWTITDCTITNNSNENNSGGGMSFTSGDNTITNCTISNNFTRFAGGGVYLTHNARITMTGCTISGNSAGYYGNAIYCNDDSASTIMNCLIIDNSGGYNAAIHCEDDTSSNFMGCTIAGNRGDSQNSGVRCRHYASAMITNSIIWDNLEIPLEAKENSSIQVVFSCIEKDWPGTGNIFVNPLFVTGPLGDYYLSQVASGQGQTSPCVDTGNDMAVNLGMDTRSTRTDDIWDRGIVDMGYHYPGNESLSAADLSGDGVVNLLDFAILAGQWDLMGSIGQPGASDLPKIVAGQRTIDASIADWPDDTIWIDLDRVYDGGPDDIPEARFALAWDNRTNTIYAAVIVTDTDHVFADQYGTWDGSDRIEVYCQGDAAGGTGWYGIYDQAQQYYLAPDTTGGSWARWPNDQEIAPDAGLEFAVAVYGNVIVYEAAVTPFDYYGGLVGQPSVVTDLDVGKVIGFDIVALTRTSSGGYGMLSANDMQGKYHDADQFAHYLLISTWDCEDLSADLDGDCYVNINDLAILAEVWLWP
ncbi:MAG: right-handed parallel beta-helix repeat-containing protein [Sedimentisphaerales bacterium]|nr:right-handed parallel beta-helix repeat-containing protein [Sedimentisphaerales bacterium]